jgi:uncharacterized membrane protein
MQSLISFFKNLTLFILCLTTFLFAFADRIVVPIWLQVIGRLHPLILHIPIGVTVLAVLLLMLRTQFKPKQFKKVMAYSLATAALTASMAACFGLLLSINGNYGEVLQQHKVSGIIFGWLSYLVLLFYQSSSEIVLLKHGGIMLLLALLIFVGHTGSILTHGENFVLAPLQKLTPQLDVKTASLYQLAVMPILEKKCFACHNESKTKGKLLMTSVEKFRRGGESGVAFVPGNPDSSRMIQYIHLPLKHDDHMPPDGKPQLTDFEITMLKSWIKAGADFDKKIAAYDPADTLIVLANSVLAKPINSAGAEYNFNSAGGGLIEELNTPFRTVFPLYASSPALQVDFFVKEYFQKEHLEELSQIKEQLVVLNLSKMPVSDGELKLLSKFTNLEILNLNFTNATGAGLSDLKSCTNLKSISLAGTKVTTESLKEILELPKLQTLYIWNTGINETQKIALEKKYPHINFIHTLFADDGMLALSKPLLINEGLLKRDELIQLKHTMPEVIIRYTLDGTKPDSVTGLVYSEPIKVDETVNLRAIACKSGWYCSELFEATVFKDGVKPEHVELLSLPDKQYLGEGGASLTDGRKGFIDVLKEPSWLGFRDNDFIAGFDFGNQPPALKKIVISYGDNLGAYIFPPVEIRIWAGASKDKLALIRTEKFTIPTNYRTSFVGSLSIQLTDVKYSYYKLVATPINKLPPWHGGKGQKGWFFVDEVFFY